MLGNLEARSDEQAVSRFRTRRVGMLLAYLAYFSDTSHDRSEVGEVLWPEGDPDKVSTNLRQALASLRRHIEGPMLPTGSVVRSQNSMLSIAQGMIETDVAEFEKLLIDVRKEPDPSVRRSALERAVALYRGELLPGYSEEWVLRERARLEDLYTHALRSLAESAEAVGQPDLAIDAVHRALAKDPYHEGLYADLMRLLLDVGQPSSALEHYREIEKRLNDELGMKPDEPLRLLAREARRRLPQQAQVKEPTPTPASQPQIAVRLPIQLTRLFGRQVETDELVADFVQANSRFVTLLGPAGVGKTTQAVVVARRLAEEHQWQVGFVPMADFANASMVLVGVADSLRASRQHPGDIIERIRSAASSGKCLVVLDNAEHILEGLAPIVSMLRSEIPELCLLVTSRQSLKVGDEQEVVLGLLDVPTDEDRPDEISHFPSVALFVDRARMIQPDFALTSRNARAVAEICIRLDGLPLAIEIAAGLCTVFTPSQMLGHLKHRLDILKTRRRDAPMRHRSLSVALDYSYETLTDEQKRFFARLSVFSGGFTLAAASNIALDVSEEGRALQALLELQERSLVLSETSDDDSSSPRFRLLESFREYGLEQLSDAQRVENTQHHAEYFLSTVPDSLNTMRAGELRLFRLSVLRDLANYWEAVRCLVDQGRVDEAVRILSVTTQFGHWGKPRKAEYDVLGDLDSWRMSTSTQALVARMRGQYQRAENMPEAHATFERAVSLARESGDPVVLVQCLVSLAALLATQQQFKEALAIYAEIHDYEDLPDVRQSISDAYNGIGTCHWMLRQVSEAEAAFSKGLSFSRDEPGEELNWLARYNLARVWIDQGRYDAAISLAGDAIRIARRLQDTFGISMGIALVAVYRWKTGDLEGALASNRESIALRRHLGLVSWLAQSVQLHAVILADFGDWERAATLLAASERHLSKRQDDDLDRASEAIRGALSPVGYRRAHDRGLMMDLDEAYELIA